VDVEEESNNQWWRTGYRGNEGDLRLYNDYFVKNPIFTESQFRRKFRMRHHLFLQIANVVEAHNSYFKQRTDALVFLVYLAFKR